MQVRTVLDYKFQWWRLAPLLLVISGLSIAAWACQDEVVGEKGIEITNARAQFTTTDVGVVYLDMRNTGEGEVLVAAVAELADDTQIHEVITDGPSTMMRPVEDGILIAPDGYIRFEPGGYHVMLLGVDKVPEVGSTFLLVLEFESSFTVNVTVQVKEFGDDAAEMHHSTSSNGGEVGHSHMDDDKMGGEHGEGKEKEHD